MLPKTAKRILDIGGGDGETLIQAGAKCSADFMALLDLSESCIERAKSKVNFACVLNVETQPLPESLRELDVILCLDILEHLNDPWNFVRSLVDRLSPSGCIIASIPNVRHYSVVLPLLLFGQWTYREAGLMDRTHLRFFVRKTAAQLMAPEGLRVDRLIPKIYPFPARTSILDILSFGMLRDFLAPQYLIRSVRA